MPRVAPSGTRRSPVPPLPLPHELPRGPVVERLSGRFDVAVTTVVAGAGFGKTTALAQAIRANDLEPHGIDIWVSCEPGDEAASRLARAIVGDGRSVEGTTSAVLAALGDLAPTDVCVVVDDVHALPAGSTAQTMLAELVARLPPHAHLLLAGRELPPLRLERLRAAGRVVDIDESELTFTPCEVDALARLHGREGPAALPDDRLGGWPSLVELSLSARGGTPHQFLWEEVVDGLPPPVRQGLLALATLGWGGAADIVRVAGAPVDCERLADVVPLVRRDDRGGYLAHHLWEHAVERIFDADDLAAVRRRALELFADRNETFRLGENAFAWGEPDAQRAAAVSLVFDAMGSLPVQTARRWLASAHADVRRAPEMRLLDAAVRHAAGDSEPSLDAELISLADGLRHDIRAQASAIALASIVAFSRGDHLRLFEIGAIADSAAGSADIPILRLQAGAAEAALASLAADVDRAIDLLEVLDYDAVPERAREIVLRLRAAMLMLAGRADEAEPFLPLLLRSHDQHVRWLPSFLRWQAGDAYTAFDLPLAAQRVTAHGDEINDRDQFIHAAHLAVIASTRGDAATARRLRPMLNRLRARDEVRDATIGALATAACLVAEHDEVAATAVMADHFERFPLDDDPLCAVHIRRHLAIAYVLDPLARNRLDRTGLGKIHVDVRTAAESLVAARGGRLHAHSALPDATVAVTAFPLPWTVELAVRARAAANADATAFLGQVAAHFRAPVRTELERWFDAGESELASAAVALMSVVRERSPVRVDVLGPLRVSVGGAEVDSAELRRGRVRALLELLAVQSPIARDRVIELMWPASRIDNGRQNLRVTLTRLRKALSSSEEDGAHSPIGSDRDHIDLGPAQVVDVDLWEFRRLTAAAERRRVDGDTGGMVDALLAAVSLWRGDLLGDLESVAGVEAEVEQIRRELVEASIRLAEAMLVSGRFDKVLDVIARALRAAPYDERAHRLAIAAHMHRRDREGITEAIDSLQRALTDLDVEPEPATAMLVRRAGTFAGASR